jgi:putative Mg2+ transporter-C (MgtC) family protein
VEWVPDAELFGRVAFASVLGLVIGLEREHRGHDAGARTFSVLCSGAALFTVISAIGFDGPADAARVASQVVVGVGFLGAGLIFRQGFSVQNLTTAASLWTTSAVGVAAGAGDLGMAAASTFLLLVLLLAEPRWLTRLLPGRPPRHRLLCRLRPGASPKGLRDLIERDATISVDGWKLTKEHGGVVAQFAVRAHDAAALDRLTLRLIAAEDVEGLE